MLTVLLAVIELLDGIGLIPFRHVFRVIAKFMISVFHYVGPELGRIHQLPRLV